MIRVRLVSSDIVSLRATLLYSPNAYSALFVLILMKAQQRRRAVANEAMVCKCKGGVFISSEEVREGQWFPCNHDDACDGMM